MSNHSFFLFIQFVEKFNLWSLLGSLELFVEKDFRGV